MLAVEKFPFKNISNERLNSILKFSLKNQPINDTITVLWKRKGVPIVTNPKPDFLNNIIESPLPAMPMMTMITGSSKLAPVILPLVLPAPTNGVYENAKSLSLKRPFVVNGGVDENEPLAKVLCKQQQQPIKPADNNNGISNRPIVNYTDDNDHDNDHHPDHEDDHQYHQDLLHDSGESESGFMHSVNFVAHSLP